MRILFLAALFAIAPVESQAESKLSTYIQGTLVAKSVKQWVVHNNEGTYWIKLSRRPNWVRRERDGKISFWVKIDQIKRFRPVKMSTAAVERP